MKRMSRLTRLTRTGLGLLAAVLLPAATGAAQQEIKPALPSDTVYGLKLVDWAVAWFQWRDSIPTTVDPSDPGGLNGAIGQRAPVWFIPPTVGNTSTREIAIPDGEGILLPAASGVFHADPEVETEAQMAVQPTMAVDQVTTLEVSLDGVAVSNPKQYRVITPVFTITIPPDNAFGDTASTVEGERRAGLASGFFFLFPPLPLGHHVLTRHVVGTDVNGNAYDKRATFNLNIEKPNEANQ
jgi:hypothetical protein